jgi:hypothetical protein
MKKLTMLIAILMIVSAWSEEILGSVPRGSYLCSAEQYYMTINGSDGSQEVVKMKGAEDVIEGMKCYTTYFPALITQTRDTTITVNLGTYQEIEIRGFGWVFVNQYNINLVGGK